MRTLFIILPVVLSINCCGQDSLPGQVLSVVDSTPIPHFSIRVNDKGLVTTDAQGNFSLPRKNGKLRLASISTFRGFDTTVKGKTTGSLKLYSAQFCDSTLAKYDLQHGTVWVFCGLAFAPMAPSQSDKEFEKKYRVRYFIVGDFLPSSVAQMSSYNLVVADYLDKRFGTKWRSELRTDVLGVFKGAEDQ